MGLKSSHCLFQQTPAPEFHKQDGLGSSLTTSGPWEALGRGGEPPGGHPEARRL